MASTGVRQLKAQLSAYLKRVRGGEVVQITDRGQLIAEIVPADWRQSLRLSPEAAALVRRGTLRPAIAELDPSTLRPVVKFPTGTAQAWLDEDRGED